MATFSRVAGATAFVIAGMLSASAQQPIQPRMGAPLPGLTPAELNRFALGKDAFDHIQDVSEGLGPIMNDTSCEHCHFGPTSGGSSGKAVTRFGVAAVGPNPFDPLDNLGGSLQQALTLPTCTPELVPAQANVVIQRITPPCFGFGLVEAIADVDIQVREFIPPPGVSGRAHIVTPAETPLGPPRVGRFGWKAQVATVLTFSGDASMMELGLSNRLFPIDNQPNGPAVAFPGGACDTVPDPEDGPDGQGFHKIDRMTDFQRFLAPPPQTPKSGMTGEAIFNAIGCASCHVSTPYTTVPVAEAALSNKTLKPYTDFLLHDMGALGDGIPQGMATETEFRTPPLWGVGIRAPVALLHDGRASGLNSVEDNLDAAIVAHGGEGAASVVNYNALSAGDKLHVHNFLLSLGRLEFDAEYDNNVSEVDWFFSRTTMTGPGVFFTPDSPIAINDIDQDGDFDLRDVAALQRAFTGT
ncbi:MAG: hypothetical protein JNL28_09365 [Planctomycetes bacterium]|nr:hypothetical protein [Planctomycetota bacterium]